MESLYIVLTIAAALVLVVWLVRKRITKLDASGTATGARLSLEAKDESSVEPQHTSQRQPGIDISGNWSFGSSWMRVFRGGTRIKDNVSAGKTRIDVGRNR
jgi:hypothetical protein